MSASKKKSRHIENDKSFKKNKEREREEMGHKFLLPTKFGPYIQMKDSHF